MERTINIIGGGITGLSTAIALHRLGIKCKVYERAPQLSEVGAGIWMQPNAMKILLQLGVGEEIRRQGSELKQVEVVRQDLSSIRKKSSQTLAQDASGLYVTSIHRARLQEILYNALPEGTVELGKEFESMQTVGDKLIVTFQDGTQAESDILLGADGIFSKVRNAVFPQSQTRYSGQTCRRGITEMQLPEEWHSSGRESWGKGVRFGFAPVSVKEVYWFAVEKAAAKGKDKPDEDISAYLQKSYQDFHPLVNEIIASTPRNKIMRHDISDLKRLSSWSKGRVCLLGDAAHATTPNMGQGGAQGIEDAWYISRFIAENLSHKETFKKFEKARRAKTDYVVNTSWQFGQAAHSSLGQSLLKFVMRYTPDFVMEKQMSKLYAVEI